MAQNHTGNDEYFSQFRFYSLGIVAAPKQLELFKGEFNGVIEVYAWETLPHGGVPINDVLATVEGTGVDSNGSETTARAKVSMSIPARWLAGNGNRISPPDVQPGERVMLYKFGDHPDFYWVSLFEDSKLRLLETVVFRFSATPDKTSKVRDHTNCYIAVVDTRSCKYYMTTSAANGEVCTSEVMFDGRTGQFSYRDSIGQMLKSEGPAHVIAAINADGSFAKLDKKNVWTQCEEQITSVSATHRIKAPYGILLDGPVTMTDTCLIQKTLDVDLGFTAKSVESKSSIAGKSVSADEIRGGDVFGNNRLN